MGPTEVGDDARSLLRYLHRTFEALRFGPFRRYLGALIWWNAAMSMQMLVRGYLAYDLTGSFAALGLLGIASAVPMLLLSPFGGVVADRTSRRAVLQIGQGFGLAMAVTVALVIFASYLTFWVLLLASVAQGAMMALVMPSRQAYLPEVREGDKRIILIDGQAAGAVNRVPAAGEARANLHVGGRAEKAELTAREIEICAAIGPTLQDRGLVFVGIDVIGDYLTEINVTSPTGIQEINRFDGVKLESQIWDAVEARVHARHREPPA